MLETIKFNGKDLEFKRKLSFGEVRKFQKAAGNLLDFDEKVKNATPEELDKLAEESMKSSDEQMELIANTIQNCLGFKDEKLNEISFPDAVVLFNEIFKASTELKKKLNQPYV